MGKRIAPAEASQEALARALEGQGVKPEKEGPPQEKPEGEEPERAAGKDPPKETAIERKSEGPKVYEVKINGRTGLYTLDQLKQLATRGGLVEKKLQELQEKETKLRQEAELYEQYRGYVSWLRENPAFAKWLHEAQQTYHKTGKIPGAEETGEALKAAGGQAASPELVQMVRQLAQRVEGLEAGVGAHHAQTTLATRIADAVSSNPILAAVSKNSMESTGVDLVLNRIRQRLETDQAQGVETDIETYAQELATEYEALAASLGGGGAEEYLASKERDSKAFRTVPDQGAGAQAAGGPERRTYTKDDLRGGRVAKDAASFLGHVLSQQ